MYMWKRKKISYIIIKQIFSDLKRDIKRKRGKVYYNKSFVFKNNTIIYIRH